MQDYLLMDPRVRVVEGHVMVNEMRQNIELMLRKKKHAVQVSLGVLCGFPDKPRIISPQSKTPKQDVSWVMVKVRVRV